MITFLFQIFSKQTTEIPGEMIFFPPIFCAFGFCGSFHIYQPVSCDMCINSIQAQSFVIQFFFYFWLTLYFCFIPSVYRYPENKKLNKQNNCNRTETSCYTYDY